MINTGNILCVLVMDERIVFLCMACSFYTSCMIWGHKRFCRQWEEQGLIQQRSSCLLRYLYGFWIQKLDFSCMSEIVYM